MATTCPLRKALNEFSEEKLEVEDLAREFPNCQCEAAVSPNGSPGPVSKGEMLRLYLTAPSHLRVKNPDDLKKRAFKVASLKRAFAKGLSVCRLDRASPAEIAHTQESLHSVQVDINGDCGGLVGAIDFPVDCVRSCPDGTAPLCAYETPLDIQEDGSYLRPSHCDLVASIGGLSDEEKKASRDIVFNQMNQIGRLRDHRPDGEFDISTLVPKAAKK